METVTTFKLVITYVVMQFEITQLPYDTLAACLAEGAQVHQDIIAAYHGNPPAVDIACFRMSENDFTNKLLEKPDA